MARRWRLPRRPKAPASALSLVVAVVLAGSGLGLAFPDRALAVGVAVGAASSGSPTARTHVTIARPAGTKAGHVLVAALASNDDNPWFTAPAGWNLIRQDAIRDALNQAIYVKVATAWEPSSYTWTLSASRRAVGGITAYAGLDTAHPVDVQDALLNTTASTQVTAPSVTTAVDGDLLVHFAAVAAEGNLTPPAAMAEEWEATAPKPNSTRDATASSSDEPQAIAGATGSRTATASQAGRSIGALVALRPAGAPPPAPDPYTPIGTFPYSEGSGVAASRQYPGVVWTHRDGGKVGTRNVVYAFQVVDGALVPFPNGELFKAFPIAGTTNVDWEDITVDGDGYLYLGDIGNNSLARTDLAVYKVREPDPYVDTSATLVATYPFRYPNGNYNAESLFFYDGTLYLINKVYPPLPHTLFSFGPLTPGLQSTLVPVRDVAEPAGGGFLDGEERITGADVNPDGRRLALVTGYRDYVYDSSATLTGEAQMADLVSRPPVWSVTHLSDGSKEQVEGITFLGDGSLVTESEYQGRIRFVASTLLGPPIP